MPAIKPIGMIADKYSRRAQAAGADYNAGIQATAPTHWESATTAAASSWNQGVTAAAASGRFASGVTGKGAKWSRNALSKGSTRYGPGVAAAAPDYTAGFTPYHDLIASVTLPPRGPRGDPGNMNRVAVLATALHKRRVGGS